MTDYYRRDVYLTESMTLAYLTLVVSASRVQTVMGGRPLCVCVCGVGGGGVPRIGIF